jgi:NADP-dependent 3-hydroxy acid dehydrogenase YdfG
MRLVLTYKTPDHRDSALQHLAGEGGEFEFIELDVCSRTGLNKAADYVFDKYGAVNLLCNNAGVGISSPLTNASYDDWDYAMRVNVDGVFTAVRSFVPRMMESDEAGHVLSTASMSGLFHGSNIGVYTTTKFAVVGMMEALRAELAAHRIGVSVFCPGLVSSKIYLSHRGRIAGGFITMSDALNGFGSGLFLYKILKGYCFIKFWQICF